MDGITFSGIIAILTVIFGVLVKVVGFPDQIRKNYQRKSTEGLSTVMIAMSVTSYVLWTIHGINQGDWVLIIGRGLGVITAGVILIQIMIYKKKN